MNYIYILIAIYFINFFFGLSLLLKEDVNLLNLIYILILIIMFPFLTPFIYFFHYNDTIIRKKIYKKRLRDDEFLTTINNNPIYEHNELTVFENGKNFLDDLFLEIDNAKKYIHMSIYTFNTDNIGKQLIKKFEKKLKENIEVKILYDKIGSLKLNKKYLKKFEELGGEIKQMLPLYFKPFFLNLNYRNHRKVIIIDNKISYIGGFNIGDKYLSRDDKMGIWVDSELKITGDATCEIEKCFLCDYVYASKNMVDFNKYLIKYKYTNITKNIQILSSGADKGVINDIESKFINIIYNAKDYIYIQTPYLILNDCLIHALKHASKRGVKIKIMIPNKKDHPFVLSATKAYAGALIDEFINIYLFNKNAFLHSKVFICDDLYVSIGTSNFDIRSFKYNLEINPFIYDREFAILVKNIFIKQLHNCKEYTKEDYKNRNFPTKLKENFAKIISTIL